MSLLSGAIGTTTGRFTISVAKNTGTLPRTATLEVGAHVRRTVTVSQLAASDCVTSVSPLSIAVPPRAGRTHRRRDAAGDVQLDRRRGHRQREWIRLADVAGDRRDNRSFHDLGGQEHCGTAANGNARRRCRHQADGDGLAACGGTAASPNVIHPLPCRGRHIHFLDTRFALLNYGATATTATLTFSRVGIPRSSTPSPCRRTPACRSTPNWFPDWRPRSSQRRSCQTSRLSWIARCHGMRPGTGAMPRRRLRRHRPCGTSQRARRTAEFDLFYLLQNPSSLATTVRIATSARSAQPREGLWLPRTRARTLGEQRDLSEARTALAATDVSAALESSMVTDHSWNALCIFRARDVCSTPATKRRLVTAPALEWFLAEGATGPLFDLFVLIANPNDQTPRSV